MAFRPRVLALVLLVGAALAPGCKKKSAEPAAGTAGASAATADLGPMDPLVAEAHTGLKKFKDEMCACPNIECADGVQMRLGKWLMEHQDSFTTIDQKSTPAQIEAARKISAEHDACARKLAGR
jgi:hypothetical protein